MNANHFVVFDEAGNQIGHIPPGELEHIPAIGHTIHFVVSGQSRMNRGVVVELTHPPYPGAAFQVVVRVM